MLRTLVRSCVLLALAAGLIPFSGGCASDRQVIAQANDVHRGLERAVVQDPQLKAYMDEVGARIVQAAREMSDEGLAPGAHRSADAAWMFENTQFHLVNSRTLNAFTTGGNHMYMYTALFAQSKSEDEFAAVVAHEFAHIYGRHVQKGMNRQYAVLGAAALAGAAGYAVGEEDNRLLYAGAFATAAAGVGHFVGMGYTRGDEDEADAYGFEMYVRAGWDPDRFGDFFQQMIDQGHDTTPELVSTHPSLRKRVERARQRARDLPPEARQLRRPPVADATRFRQLQQRALQLASSMPGDETLAKAQLLLAAFPSCVTPEDQPDQRQAQTELLRALNAPAR